MESRTASAPAADGGRRAGERAGTADVAIAAAILAGLVLRVAAARQKVLWFDEFLSANLIRHRWTDLLAAVRVEAHPPLYFVLLKLWCLPFGDGPAGLKSLSIVAGTAAAAVLADAVRRVRGDAAGIAAALLVSLANVQINQSSEAKPYAVLTFFLAALVWSIVRDRERPDGGSLASTWGAGAAAASTHFFGGAAAGAVALAAVLFGSRPERRRATTLFAIVLAVSAIWLVPAFSIPSGAADYIRDMWVGTGPAAPIVVSTRIALPSWPRRFPASAILDLARPGIRELIGIAVAATVVAGGRRRKPPGEGLARTGRFLTAVGLGLWAGFILLESVLAAAGHPVAIIGRSEVVVELGVAILLATAVCRWRRPVLPIAALAVIALLSAIPVWRWGSGARPLRWEDGIVRHVRAAIAPGAHVDIVTLGLARPPFEYYADGDSRFRFLSFPEAQNAHPGWAAHSVSPAERAALASEAERLIALLDAELDRGVAVYVAARPDLRNDALLSALRRDHDVKPVSWGASWFLQVTKAPVLSAGG